MLVNEKDQVLVHRHLPCPTELSWPGMIPAFLSQQPSDSA